jgi:toxin FitB
MYLLDTNVVSELRKRRGDSGVKKWVAGQSAADLAISVVTIIEIETGILWKQRTDP